MASYGTTVSNALRYLLGSSKVSEIDDGLKALAEDVDTKMLGGAVGLHSARPAAAYANRIYFETDTPGLFHDTASAWEEWITDRAIFGPAITQAGPLDGQNVPEKSARTNEGARLQLVYLYAQALPPSPGSSR